MYAFYRSQLFRFVALVSQLPLWLASRVFARSAKQAMSALSLSLVLNTPIIVRAQERVGTSCADCPNYSGAFSIENQTGVMIRYQVRWGDKHPWKSISLNSGQVETHSYPLGENRNGKAPTPYVRFDGIGGDGRFTPKEYRMEFYAIGYAGYGPKANNTTPKKYFFKYAADGRTLDILAR
jgi:hypothetical protein